MGGWGCIGWVLNKTSLDQEIFDVQQRNRHSKCHKERNLPLTPLNSARATVAGSRRVFPMGRSARTGRDSEKANRSFSYENVEKSKN